MRVMSYETKFQMSNTEVAALLDKISLLWSVIYTVSEKKSGQHSVSYNFILHRSIFI